MRGFSFRGPDRRLRTDVILGVPYKPKLSSYLSDIPADDYQRLDYNVDYAYDTNGFRNKPLPYPEKRCGPQRYPDGDVNEC